MKDYRYVLIQISIFALAGSFIFTTLAIKDINSTIGNLVKQDTSIVQFNGSTIEVLSGMTQRIDRLEARELDLSFQGRQNLIAGLTLTRYFDKVASQIYKTTGYGMMIPEYKTIDEEGHIDWNNLNIHFQRDIGESTIGYSREYEYIQCKSADDGVGSREWSSLADEIHDGVINCREGLEGTGAVRPNFEQAVNKIIHNTKFEF